MCCVLNVNIFAVFLVCMLNLNRASSVLTDYVKEELIVDDQGSGGLTSFSEHLLRIMREVNVSTGCYREVELFLAKFLEKEGWALEMFDATAKFPSGLFSGKALQLGEYDQCVSLRGAGPPEMKDGAIISGKYCLVLADVSARKDAPPAITRLIHRIRGENLLISNINNTGHFIPRFSTIHIGVCIPAGCSAFELESALNALKRHLLLNQVDLNISVKDEMCSANTEQRELPTSAKSVLGIYLLVVIISLIATIIDSKFFQKIFHSYTKNRIFTGLASFSLKRNFKILLEDKREDLPCISGIRALCTLMLYFAHKIIILCMTPYNNRHALIQDSQMPLTAVFRSSMIYTDTFLLLSGVLSSYNFCKEIRRKGHIAWFSRFFTRYMRLTPAFFAILLYYAFVMEHMGSGPQWPTVIKPNADLCRKNMLWNLLYVNNFFPFQEMCVTQSHQLAVDMQLFLVTPGLIYLLHDNHKIGFLFIFAMNLGSTFLRYFVVLNNNISLIIPHGVTVEELYKAADLCYSQTLHRATPYLFGVYTGFLLHKYKSSSRTHIPWLLVGGLWVVIIGGGIWPIWQLAHLSGPGHFVAQDSAFYAAISPVIWASAMSSLIICCCFGYAEPLRKLLSNSILSFLSKVSYTVFLSQFAVFFHRLASVRHSQNYTKMDLIVTEEVLLVLGVSILITLLFDLPVQNMRAILVRGKNEEKTESSEEVSKDVLKHFKKGN